MFDNTSRFSFRNLARVAEELGENIDDEEMQHMIAQSDRVGEIKSDEFYRIMKAKGNLLEGPSFDDDFELRCLDLHNSRCLLQQPPAQ